VFCCSWSYFHQAFYFQQTNGALNNVAKVLDILGLCSFVFMFFSHICVIISNEYVLGPRGLYYIYHP